MKVMKKEIKRLKKEIRVAKLIIGSLKVRFEKDQKELYEMRGALYYKDNPLKPTNLAITENNAPTVGQGFVLITKGFTDLMGSTNKRNVERKEKTVIKQGEQLLMKTEELGRMNSSLTALKELNE